MASPTVFSLSASSSGMSIPNSSSSAMTSSTMSSESAPRSSMNLASGVSCFDSTSSSFAMISFTRSSLNVATDFTSLLGVRTTAVSHHHPAVNGPHLTGHVGGARRSEERDDLGDLFGPAQTAERDLAEQLRLGRRRQLRRH